MTPTQPDAGLTDRQLQVAYKLGQGKSDKQIACELGITKQRVAQIVVCIGRRLHFPDGTDARLEIAVRFYSREAA